MSNLLTGLQVFIALLLILVLMLQVKGTTLSGFFGESQGPRFSTKRGLERVLFQATLVIVAAFVLISLLAVRLQ
ncbi:MAG: preprotein translocase subunit SecG [Actinobacteria bacterium RBG_16_67_10]|nr:MAG: preprotein translocase subunit SecG [Actinobacteria bacterium RBG_16_67_10]HLF09497.1 preprotein translocase subunit SecG [Dehalococcoidia bacterium]